MAHPAVELTLYVRRGSAACDRAREAVQSALAAFDPDAVSVKVVHIDSEDGPANDERVTTAPVVKLQRGTGEPSWMLNFEVETLTRRLRWLGLKPRRSAGPRPIASRPATGR